MRDDEIWDEDRWEAFLREDDRRLDRYMDLVFGFMADHPPPDVHDPRRAEWEVAFRAFLHANGLRPDRDAPSFLSADEPPPDAGDATDELAPGWLFGADDDVLDDDVLDDEDALADVEHLAIYQAAFEVASDVLDWTNALPATVKDSTLVQLCTQVSQMPANVAKGHAIGYEHEMIGGNIACAKRALAAANEALRLFQELQAEADYLDDGTYRGFYERVYEVRNALGLYVQELRARFELGLD